MPQVQPDYVAGFGIPFPLGVLRSALTMGEDGLSVGVPEPQRRTDGSLPSVQITPAGPQEAGTTMKVQYVTPGFPPAAGYVCKEAADDDWQGRDTPLLGVYAEALAAETGGGAVENDQSHGLTLPNGTRIVARRHNALTGARIKVLSRTATATSWTDTAIGSTGHAHDAALWPCLLRIEQAVLLFHWRTDTTANTAQIDAHQSLDGGVTWVRYQRSILPALISTATYTLGRIRAVVLNGQIALYAHITDPGANPAELIKQYASSDRGAKLVLVDTLSGDSSGSGAGYGVGMPDAVVYDGRIVVSVADVTDQHIRVWVTGNAWTPLTYLAYDADFGHMTSAFVTVAAREITDADHALAVLEGGVYLLGRTPAAPRAVEIIRWLGRIADRDIAHLGIGPAGSGYGCLWFQDGTPSAWPRSFCAWGWRGRLEVACNWVSSATTYDDQLWLLSAGGNTTVCQPFNRRFHGDVYQACWDRVYLPVDLPTTAAYGWTGAGAGTESITTTPGRLRITTVAAQRYYTWTETGSPAEARLGIFLEQLVGGGVTARALACGIRYGDTGIGFECEIRFSATQARLRDVNAAADVATVDVDVAGGVYVMLAVSATGNVTAGVAPVGEQHERVYQMLANGYALTDDAGAGGTDVIYMVGHRATDTVTSEWAFIGVGHDATFAASTALGDGQDNPEDLTPIPGGEGTHSYLGHGVYILARGGPAWVGDEIWIPAAPVYGARNLLCRGWEGDDSQDRGGLRLSPRSTWRSSSPASPWRLPFQLPSRATERVPRGFLFLHIEGANFPICTLSARTGGVWSSIGTWQGARTATFTRTGARVVLSGAATTYLRTNDLKGGYIQLDDGAGNKLVRPVLRNTGGFLGAGTAGPIVVVDIDPSSLTGAEATSGTAGLYYARATLIVPVASSATYDAYALTFAEAPAATNVWLDEDGDGVAKYRAGKAVIGEIWTVSKPDWGIQRIRESNTELMDLENGHRTARVRGPRRRVFELPYTSIRSEGFLDDSGTATWYYLQTGGALAGMLDQEPEIIEGVLEELEGSAGMCVYIPVIAADGGATMRRGSEAGIYGRLTTEAVTWTLEHGDLTDGHFAGARLRIEEEK